MKDDITHDDILDMDEEEIDDCIAELPIDAPLMGFALKQRDYMATRRNERVAAVSSAVSVVTLFVLVSTQFAESYQISAGVANWSLLIAVLIAAGAYFAVLFGARMVRSLCHRLNAKLRNPDQ